MADGINIYANGWTILHVICSPELFEVTSNFIAIKKCTKAFNSIKICVRELSCRKMTDGTYTHTHTNMKVHHKKAITRLQSYLTDRRLYCSCTLKVFWKSNKIAKIIWYMSRRRKRQTNSMQSCLYVWINSLNWVRTVCACVCRSVCICVLYGCLKII